MDWVDVKVMYMLTRLIDSSPVLHLLSGPVWACDLQDEARMQTVHYHLDWWHVMAESAQGPENAHTHGFTLL